MKIHLQPNIFFLFRNLWIVSYHPKCENYLLEVDEHLVIPTGARIRFLITANDVIHSWWVPDFAIKQDAIPGFVNTGWTQVNEPGIFRGQCTELCGQYHGYMPIVVEAVSPEEYKEFIIQKKEAKLQQAALTEKFWTTEELMAMGEGVYQKNCVACHQVNVEGCLPVLFAGWDRQSADVTNNNVQTAQGLGGVMNPLFQCFLVRQIESRS